MRRYPYVFTKSAKCKREGIGQDMGFQAYARWSGANLGNEPGTLSVSGSSPPKNKMRRSQPEMTFASADALDNRRTVLGLVLRLRLRPSTELLPTFSSVRARAMPFRLLGRPALPALPALPAVLGREGVPWGNAGSQDVPPNDGLGARERLLIICVMLSRLDRRRDGFAPTESYLPKRAKRLSAHLAG